jgi:hypothetical protein
MLLFLSFHASIDCRFICGSSWLPMIYCRFGVFESARRLRKLFEIFGDDFVAVAEFALEIFGDA